MKEHSQFLPFLPDFSQSFPDFSLFFLIFGNFFFLSRGHSDPPCPSTGYTNGSDVNAITPSLCMDLVRLFFVHVTNTQGRSQTLYIALCNGVVSHGLKLGFSMFLLTTHAKTKAKQMHPRSLRVYFYSQTAVDTVDVHAPKEPQLF